MLFFIDLESILQLVEVVEGQCRITKFSHTTNRQVTLLYLHEFKKREPTCPTGELKAMTVRLISNSLQLAS